MKKYIFNVFVFIVILVCIKYVILSIVPYHYGNPWISSKIQYLNNNSLKPDVVFFGSSRIYRQINPTLVDSLLLELGFKNLKSFNLGAPATFTPQSYYLYLNYLKSECATNTKIAFIELQNIIPIDNNLSHQERSSYWLNLSNYTFIINSTLHRKDISLKDKLALYSSYSQAFIENIFGIGYFESQLFTKNYYSKFYLGLEKNGFLPLDYEYKEKPNQDLADRKNSLTIEELDKRYCQAIESNKNYDVFDKKHAEYINEILEISKKRNIELFFIIPPRCSSKSLIALSKNINVKTIDLSTSSQFYQLEYSFDNGHMNSYGANLLTKALIEDYLIHKSLMQKLNLSN